MSPWEARQAHVLDELALGHPVAGASAAAKLAGNLDHLQLHHLRNRATHLHKRRLRFLQSHPPSVQGDINDNVAEAEPISNVLKVDATRSITSRVMWK